MSFICLLICVLCCFITTTVSVKERTESFRSAAAISKYIPASKQKHTSRPATKNTKEPFSFHLKGTPVKKPNQKQVVVAKFRNQKPIKSGKVFKMQIINHKGKKPQVKVVEVPLKGMKKPILKVKTVTQSTVSKEKFPKAKSMKANPNGVREKSNKPKSLDVYEKPRKTKTVHEKHSKTKPEEKIVKIKPTEVHEKASKVKLSAAKEKSSKTKPNEVHEKAKKTNPGDIQEKPMKLKQVDDDDSDQEIPVKIISKKPETEKGKTSEQASNLSVPPVNDQVSNGEHPLHYQAVADFIAKTKNMKLLQVAGHQEHVLHVQELIFQTGNKSQPYYARVEQTPDGNLQLITFDLVNVPKVKESRRRYFW